MKDNTMLFTVTKEVEVEKIYMVVNPDKTYAGVPCVSIEEAVELAIQVEGRRIYEIDQYECEVDLERYIEIFGK